MPTQPQPPRRSEQIHLQHERAGSGSTHAIIQNVDEEYTTLAVETQDNKIINDSSIYANWDNQGISYDDYFAISAEPSRREQGEEIHFSQDLTLPMTTKNALSNPTWKKSMDDEIKAQIEKETWELVIPPSGVNIVGSTWKYVLKKYQKGAIVHAKSRLVAQGFSQTFGDDYDETYAPVVRMTSLRVICAIAAQNNWPIHQMDVDIAYLNAKLQDPIYMRKPPGYFERENE